MKRQSHRSRTNMKHYLKQLCEWYNTQQYSLQPTNNHENLTKSDLEVTIDTEIERSNISLNVANTQYNNNNYKQ